MALKATPFTPQPKVRKCMVCRHSWANEYIEESLTETHKLGHPRPTIRRIHQRLLDEAEEHGSEGLEAAPPFASLERHLIERGESPAWKLWNGKA